MNTTLDSARARRYLLGEVSEEERELIEQEYFEREDALDRLEAAEEDLIEDYVAQQLPPAERERFERNYLAVPQHRVRVETVRRLMACAAQAKAGGATPMRPVAVTRDRADTRERFRRRAAWLALAATLLLAALVTLLRLGPSEPPPQEIVEQRPPVQPAPPEAVREPAVFAITISPTAVRSSESPTIVVPRGADIVQIRLQSDGEDRNLTATRAVVQTVAGDEQWRGPVAAQRAQELGVVARLDVPASQLPADDYIVILYGTNAAGQEQEWARYFLPVRAQ